MVFWSSVIRGYILKGIFSFSKNWVDAETFSFKSCITFYEIYEILTTEKIQHDRICWF